MHDINRRNAIERKEVILISSLHCTWIRDKLKSIFFVKEEVSIL